MNKNSDKKLKLDALEVKSFVTNMDTENGDGTAEVNGGGTIFWTIPVSIYSVITTFSYYTFNGNTRTHACPSGQPVPDPNQTN